MPMTPSDRSFATSREWDRICPPTLKLTPRYSDSYRKRMDLQANFHPDMGSNSASSTVSNPPSLSSSISTSSTTSSIFEDNAHGRAPEDRFRSLTDLKWGEFEMLGFGELSDNKKLEFDLTEGARAVRPVVLPLCCYVLLTAVLPTHRTRGHAHAVTGPCREACDAQLAGLLFDGLLPDRRAAECDPPVQLAGLDDH